MSVAEPLYPAGTAEYEAYRAELLVELEKFRRGEDPYPYALWEESEL